MSVRSWILLLVVYHPSVQLVFDSFPPSHRSYHMFKHPDEIISKSPGIKTECWGYEIGCQREMYFSFPYCTDFQKTRVRNLEEQAHRFWVEADFGFIKQIREDMMALCIPTQKIDSSLRCSPNMHFCQATNLFMDFTSKIFSGSNNRFHEDLFVKGDIGGFCKLKKSLLSQQSKHKSALQSWFAELEQYSSLPFRPIEDKHCDKIFEKPVIFMKLDAGINMYHHFCDFVNLYASQHINGSFSTDIYIVIWDTSSMYYYDPFEETWRAFTQHPIIKLNQFQGQRVCFREAVFPLLPRRVRGLYYNMPLVRHCYCSGLMKAFSEHSLYRLGIAQEYYKKSEIRITLLVRSTKYRRILNQEELSGSMRKKPNFRVRVVDYSYQMPFLEQLKITANTDIFIGIHGAGLTHLIFLPDWAVIFELYNTEDPDCYRDLARLRGIKYITWENKQKLFQEDEGHHPTLGAHAKFTNYAFDVEEFNRLIDAAVKHVRVTRPQTHKKTDKEEL